MIKYFNIYAINDHPYSNDWIRWVGYDSLEKAQEDAPLECPSYGHFKKTIIIEVDEDYDEDNDLDDDFFEEKFPNTRHCDGGDVYYDIPN